MKTKSAKRRMRGARAKRAPSRRAQGQQKWLQRRPRAPRLAFVRPDPQLGQPDVSWTWQGVRRGGHAPL